MFVIRNAKAGKDIHLPITPEIAFAISLAVNAEVKPHHEVKETDLVFPGCRQISQRAALPIRGQALRHSYSTVAVDLKIDDLIRHFLMGHAPKGISQNYVALLILQHGPAMREAQEQISKRIFKLLGLTLGVHHDAPLVPDAPNRVEAARKKAKPPLWPASLETGQVAGENVCLSGKTGSDRRRVKTTRLTRMRRWT
jgi:hypothetical protein